MSAGVAPERSEHSLFFQELQSRTETLRAALPYSVGAWAVYRVGFALPYSTVAMTIVSLALGIFGYFALLGVLSAYCFSSTPREFDEKIWKHMALAVMFGWLELMILL